ncbi:MAG: HAD family hydrolase [Oscillatoria sp. SIO1A7]|nr:HAD family hydrolase [Oscillatoria sp. SIO1A7]
MTGIQCRDVRFDDIEAVIFDKDGTLANSGSFLRSLGQKRSRLIDAQIPGVGEPLLMAFGIADDNLDPTGLMAVGSRRENEIAAAAYIAETGRGWLESLEIARKAFDEAEKVFGNEGPAPMFEGSLEVLKLLSGKGLKLGILSADTTDKVQDFVSHHQLENYIELAMGVDSGPSKPDPSLFIKGCQSLGVEPAATLMVGDSPVDIEMAKRAGAAGCIGIGWGKPRGDRLEGASVAIARLNEIRVIS